MHLPEIRSLPNALLTPVFILRCGQSVAAAMGESRRDFKRFLSFINNNLDAPVPCSPRREDYSVLDETRKPSGRAEPKRHSTQQNCKTNPIPKMDTSPPSPNPLRVLIQPRTQTRTPVPQ